MLQLLEKIPFSDPSLLPPTYRAFGKQAYDLLHKFDVKEEKDGPYYGYVAENTQNLHT